MFTVEVNSASRAYKGRLVCKFLARLLIIVDTLGWGALQSLEVLSGRELHGFQEFLTRCDNY